MTLPIPTAPRRLAYLGTPELAVPTLDALVRAGYEVAVVVTRPDARRGRRGEPEPSPVKAAALGHGLTVAHDVDAVLDAGVDLAVVVAYGRLIPNRVLERVPMVNLHFSLLPRWRGAAPVERALLAGDERTGVCVMDVVEALDEGDVFARSAVEIRAHDTLASLRATLVAAGTELLLDSLAHGFGPSRPQQGEVTYAAKLQRDDLRLDFTEGREPVRRVVALGDAWTTFRGRRLKILEIGPRLEDEAAAPAGTLRPPDADHALPRIVSGGEWFELVEVQPEGKAPMDGRSWANGARLAPDDRLGA